MSERKDDAELSNGLPEHLRPIEELLEALQPRPSGVNRDRVLFLAGRASALASRKERLGRWRWPAATVCAACAGALVGIFISAHSSLQDRGQTVHSGRDPAPQRLSDVPPSNPRSVSLAEPTPVAASHSDTSSAVRAGKDPFAGGGRQFTLLALRGQLLADSPDFETHAPESPRAPSGGRPGGLEPSVGYHDLLRRCLEAAAHDAL